MELFLERPAHYRVKHGQTLSAIAAAFCIPPRLLAAENNLTEEPFEGQILKIPAARGNLYQVQGGESKTLLCGSPTRYEEKNKTKLFYPHQTVLL